MSIPGKRAGRKHARPKRTPSERHAAELAESGIPPKYATANGVYTETDPAKISEILGWARPALGHGTALVFTYLDESGKPTGISRLKLDVPRTEVRKGGGKRKVKYEWPKGKPPAVYIPTGTREAVADGSDMIVTEGEKKALCADYHGFPCVSVPGVEAWRAGGEMIPSMAAIRWAGRTVFIAFDSDAASNPKMLKAEAALANALTGRGATVKVIRFPEGGAA